MKSLKLMLFALATVSLMTACEKGAEQFVEAQPQGEKVELKIEVAGESYTRAPEPFTHDFDLWVRYDAQEPVMYRMTYNQQKMTYESDKPVVVDLSVAKLTLSGVWFDKSVPYEVGRDYYSGEFNYNVNCDFTWQEPYTLLASSAHLEVDPSTLDEVHPVVQLTMRPLGSRMRVQVRTKVDEAVTEPQDLIQSLDYDTVVFCLDISAMDGVMADGGSFSPVGNQTPIQQRVENGWQYDIFEFVGIFLLQKIDIIYNDGSKVEWKPQQDLPSGAIVQGASYTIYIDVDKSLLPQLQPEPVTMD